ncbi:hypothetical protein [Costertonia aggregata]|uniref:Uncharacterized protein n=1 Tax=Costertonia aggregata TaxID=343403 RepID=A0A7H9AN95_9FLAO|nr:hypothetical protein [Costertonia aggregata]QLG44897.1 hypothetical protein HYG79_05865 [Costertonia aggregata]
MLKGIYWKVEVGDITLQQVHITPHFNFNLNRMNFNIIIKEILGSVLNLFGFTLKEESKGIIEYDHEKMSISFSYDFNRSFEVVANFLFKANNKSYKFGELKEFLIKENNRFTTIQILEDDKLKTWAKELKIFLQNHLDFIIKNHAKVCFELDVIRKQNVLEYNNERDERYFKEDVDRLWKDKDYMKLTKLIENYKGNLDSSLKKKYEYAIKRLS